MPNYLKWQEKNIIDFSARNITSLYDDGFIFTRINKGAMNQTRSLRIDLKKFLLSSENRRVLKKINSLELTVAPLPYSHYHWSIGKLAKDFYDIKFGEGIFTANKVKEILTEKEKSNFNKLLTYSLDEKIVGYCIAYANSNFLHYSYPFYNLSETQSNLGMGMMLQAIMHAQKENKKYIYLGSFQRPTDVYKLQFAGLEWFDEKKWSKNLEDLKRSLI